MATLTWADIKDLALVSDTRWTRVEGTPRNEATENPLAARLEGGPHWMLAQQYRFGELMGDDAASPVAADLNWKSKSFADTSLLEPRVEADPFIPDLRCRIQAGQELARGLSPEVLQTCLASFPLPDASGSASPAERAMLRALTGRVADGLALLADYGNAALPGPLQIAEIDAAAARLIDWLARTYSLDILDEMSGAWDPVELEYHGSVALDDQAARLEIDDHLGGRLDWWAFDMTDAPDWSATDTMSQRVTPTAITFPGMPTGTHWQLQDRAMDFGRIEAERTDLARMILVEFALVFGEDWFAIPIDQNRGSLTRLGDIEVTDSFGEVHVVPPSGAGSRLGWDIWSTATPSGGTVPEAERSRLLVLPPVTASANEGPPIEDVMIVRDEMANLVWGIERQVEDGLGRAETLDFIADPTPLAQPPSGAQYQLLSDMPHHWHPFSVRSAQANGPGRTRALELIPILRSGPDGSISAAGPRGRILSREAPEGSVRLAEEVAGRAPLRLVRRFERARDETGRVILWTTTRRAPAAPQPRSGLKFDTSKI